MPIQSICYMMIYKGTSVNKHKGSFIIAVTDNRPGRISSQKQNSDPGFVTKASELADKVNLFRLTVTIFYQVLAPLGISYTTARSILNVVCSCNSPFSIDLKGHGIRHGLRHMPITN